MTTSSPDIHNLNVAVILVNWNNWHDCVECLDALLAQRHERMHVFIVDNQSSDDSVQNILQWCAQPRAMPGWRGLPGVLRYTDANSAPAEPIIARVLPAASMPSELPAGDCRLTLVHSGANRGFAGGCNVGIATAGIDRFDYFWFLNTDTVVDGDSLSALLRRARERPEHGLVGSTLRHYALPDKVQALAGGELDKRTMTTRHIAEGAWLSALRADIAMVEARLAYVCGASMLASQQFIRRVGLMQEDYFLYYEEYDWAMRGRTLYSLGYAPDSHVFHKIGASSGKVRPLLTSRLFYRNRVRFTSRFYPQHLGLIKRGLMLELLRQTVRGRWRLARAVAETLWNAGRLSREASTNV